MDESKFQMLNPDLTGTPLPPAPTCRVVVPFAEGGYVDLVRMTLENQGIEAEYHEMADQGSGYPDLFSELWEGQEPFLIVEHDILVWPGALYMMSECQHPWCTASYQLRNRLESWMGCVKFDPARLGPDPTANIARRFWQFDVPVTVNLYTRGLVKHTHQPGVVHLHDYR